MQEDSNRIINIATENQPIDGCTISKQVYMNDDYNISYFSLAKDTSISAESYVYSKICIMNAGKAIVFDINKNAYNLKEFDCIILPTDIPVGIKTDEGCIYTEISLKKESKMNQKINSGEVFRLAELLPYQDGKIINMDIVNDEKLKFVIMSFDEGTGLSEHAAPGEALVFALDGEGIIGYEGKEFTIKAGETFKFDKNGKHYVKATKKFKMALLLVLE